jgi:hypothetical protein
MDQGSIILVDTCIIIEAVRTNCWKAICSHFVIESVEKCEEEARTGYGRRPGYVTIDETALRLGIKRAHQVTNHDRAQLAIALATAYSLDDGERDLLAHAYCRKDAFLIASADKAAVLATLDLGWRDRIISLEKIAKASGINPVLKLQYCENWLSTVCTDWTLGSKLLNCGNQVELPHSMRR